METGEAARNEGRFQEAAAALKSASAAAEAMTKGEPALNVGIIALVKSLDALAQVYQCEAKLK
jgi:hypothetical protein